MANYNSNKAGAGIIPKWLPDSSGVNVVATYTWTTSVTLNTGDTVTLMTVPPGVAVVDMALDVDPLDQGGAIVISIGDATVPTRYLNNSTIARTGGYVNSNTRGWLGTFTYSVNTPLILTVNTGGSGAVTAGNGLRVYIVYSTDV